jgi:hypothetical protein
MCKQTLWGILLEVLVATVHLSIRGRATKLPNPRTGRSPI